MSNLPQNSRFFTHCTLTHMTKLMTYPYTTSHIPSNHKCFRAFSRHGAIRRGAFRHGAHGDRRLRRQEDRGGAWCASCGGCARTAHRATAWCGGWCVSCFSCYLSRIARIVMCASRLLVHRCTKERFRASALINTWISVEPCCTVAGVRKQTASTRGVMVSGIMGAHFVEPGLIINCEEWSR